MCSSDLNKDYRNQGIGQNLYNQIEDYCKNKDINEIILTTSKKMIAATKFYKKNGFKIVKINKENKIFMKKILT